MSTNDINATLEIRGGAQGGSDPWAKTVSLTLDANGYHDPEGVGSSGVDPAYIAAPAAAALLLEAVRSGGTRGIARSHRRVARRSQDVGSSASIRALSDGCELKKNSYHTGGSSSARF